MCEESEPPLSEEFSALVSETRLGGSLVQSLEHMAEPLQIRDLDMVVQAICTRQTVGARLADLFHMADVIRARDEVKREVMVLTAEGRIAAYVLAGLVPSLFAMIQVMPLLSGTGLFVLAGCGLSVSPCSRGCSGASRGPSLLDLSSWCLPTTSASSTTS